MSTLRCSKKNLLVRVLVWVRHISQSVKKSILSEHFRIEDCDRVVDREKVGSEEFDITRGNPIVGELLCNVTIDMVFIILVLCQPGFKSFGEPLTKTWPGSSAITISSTRPREDRGI